MVWSTGTVLDGSLLSVTCASSGSLTMTKVTVASPFSLAGTLPAETVPFDNCTVGLTASVLDWSLQPANTSDTAVVVRSVGGPESVWGCFGVVLFWCEGIWVLYLQR